MKTKTGIAVAVGAVLTVITVSVFSFLALNYGWWIGEIPAADAKLATHGYLTYRSGNFLEESRLFLISATARYGTYRGQGCFIINASIRNDYSLENPPPGGRIHGLAPAYFGLAATLSHNNGTVDARDVTGPEIVPLDRPQYSLASGETGWFEVDLATLNRNVDSFSISLVSVSNGPVP